MPEFAFEFTMNAIARVTAADENEARAMLAKASDCVEFGRVAPGVRFTEANLAEDTQSLFEIDGKRPPFPSPIYFDRAARDDGWLPQDSDTAEEYCAANDIDASKAFDDDDSSVTPACG